MSSACSRIHPLPIACHSAEWPFLHNWHHFEWDIVQLWTRQSKFRTISTSGADLSYVAGWRNFGPSSVIAECSKVYINKFVKVKPFIMTGMNKIFLLVGLAVVLAGSTSLTTDTAAEEGPVKQNGNDEPKFTFVELAVCSITYTPKTRISTAYI